MKHVHVFTLFFLLNDISTVFSNTNICPAATSAEHSSCTKPKNQKSDVAIPTEKEVAKNGHFAGIKPLHYDWTLKFLNDSSFQGSLNVVVQATKQTKFVLINSKELDIDFSQVWVRKCGAPNETICVESYTDVRDENVLILKLKEELKQNGKYELVFGKYFGGIGYYDLYDEAASGGIWRNDRRSSSWAAATIFQMRYARKAFPCFDHPALKATFKICIAHESDTLALSNTAKQSSTKEGDWMKDCFEETLKIPTYVVTVSLLANFTKLMNREKSPTLEIYFPAREPEVKYAWEIQETRRILDFFEQELHLSYNVSKFGILNISPVQFWGIENFGLVSIESGQPSNMVDREETIHRILVHEIVHQWLGNVATVSHWDEICLQEGLTAYLEWSITDRLKLVNVTFAQKLKETLQSTWDTSNSADRGIVTDTLIDIYSLTQGIANFCFSRPPIILNMIAASYGKDIWFKFFAKLIEKFSYSHANLADWVQMLNEVAGNVEAGQILESWYTSKGIPVMYARAPSSGQIQLHQKVFSDSLIDPDNVIKTPYAISNGTTGSKAIYFKQNAQTFQVNVSIENGFVIDPDLITFTKKLYAPSNYLKLLKCRSAGKCTDKYVQAGFVDLCEGLSNDYLPWLPSAEGDVDAWKQLFAEVNKLFKEIGAGMVSLVKDCECAFRSKEEIKTNHTDCLNTWNYRWKDSKIMTLIDRVYTIENN